METLGFWAAAVTAAILVGMAKGGIPAIGMLSVPIMALSISPVVAAGILLPVYVVSDMFGLWAYRRAYNKKVLILLIPGAILGIALGGLTANIVPEAAVTLLVGLVGFSFSLNLLLRSAPKGPSAEAQVGKGLFWGVIAGFTSFVSHSGAPPYQVYVLPLRLDKASFAGTATIAFAIINAVKLIPYYLLGQINLVNLKLSLVMALPAIPAVFFGVWIVKVIPTERFFGLVTWALLLISAKLIWDGARALNWF